MSFHKLIRFGKKFAATIMASSMMAVVVFSFSGCNVVIEDEQTSAEGETVYIPATHTIRLTYVDDTYTAYFKDCIEQYQSLHADVKIILNQVDSDNYLENISVDSLNGESVSDVYLLNTSQLGTAYLAGLAAKNTLSMESGSYCDTAIESCSYDGSMIAYPLAFRTTFLAYNKEYVTDEMADEIRTFDDIAAFAASIYEDDYVDENGSVYEGTTSDSRFDQEKLSQIDFSYVETIFECNLSDLFLNYGYIGNGIDIGGTYGCNPQQIEIASDTTVKDAYRYLDMIAFYNINTERDYDSVINRFVEGKSIFTIMSTDTLAYMEQLREERLEEEASSETSAENGDAAVDNAVTGPEFEFGVITFPDYNAEAATSPLSITTALVVNPYSTDAETAEAFAYFATFSMANSLYKDCGLLSARSNVFYKDRELGGVYDSYAKSTSKNKLQYGEAVYPMIEIALHNIVAGEDPKAQLEAVDAYMETQIK